MPILAQILVKPFHSPFTRVKPYESHPFAYYLHSPFKILPLRTMAQVLVKPLHSPIPCEVLLKYFHYASWPKSLWNSSICPFPVKSFYNPPIMGHGPNSWETPPFAYSLWTPFKIPSLRIMAQILLKPLHSPIPCQVLLKSLNLRIMAQILLKPLLSPIPCQVLLKSLNYESWPKFFWNPFIRLFPVKSF